MGFDYEGTLAKHCIYNVPNQNIFKPKKLGLLQRIGKNERIKIFVIS